MYGAWPYTLWSSTPSRSVLPPPPPPPPPQTPSTHPLTTPYLLAVTTPSLSLAAPLLPPLPGAQGACRVTHPPHRGHHRLGASSK